MNKILLSIIISVFTLSAAVYTITPEKETHDYFYTLPHIVERIPELHVRVFDATDQDISRNGRSSMFHNSLQLFIDGTETAPFQDGFLLTDLKSILNSAIDSIEIYTGVHAVQWGGNSRVVINIVTKSIEKNSIEATGYIGSEMGDPVVLLAIMDEDQIPYNKEQFAAGEIYGRVKTGSLAQAAGLKLIYMDRYSNSLEKQRSRYYPYYNSSLHMEEIRNGTYQLQHSAGKSRTNLSLAVDDYNIFRYDHFRKRHTFFEGTRGNLLINQQFKGDRITAAFNMGTLVENGEAFETDAISTHSLWGDISWRTKVALTEYPNYSISVLGSHLLNRSPYMQEDSAGNRNHEPVEIGFNAKWFEGMITSSLSFPPRLTVTGQIPLADDLELTGAAAVSYREDDLEQKEVALLSEVSITKKFIRSALCGRAGYDYEPELTRASRGVKYGTKQHIPWGELGYELNSIGTASLFASTYEIRGDLRISRTVNGLTLGGALGINSATAWDSSSAMQKPLSKRHENSVETLPTRITGELFMQYALFKDHLQLAMAVRDLGRVRFDFIHGCKVGPVMVSNLRILF